MARRRAIALVNAEGHVLLLVYKVTVDLGTTKTYYQLFCVKGTQKVSPMYEK